MSQQEFPLSLLSKPAILRHLQKGNIIIDPFCERNLHTVSYDVTLGEYYWREQQESFRLGLFNPYDEDHVKRVWGTQYEKAKPAQELLEQHDLNRLKGIDPQDLVITIGAHETILCHTGEYIGGRNCVTGMMKARSSMGRVFIEVCKCAGWGDVGYFNKWTMELTNNSEHHTLVLCVGRRIAQMAFFEVEPLEEDYASTGKYQADQELEVLKQKWTPFDMLPKLYKDFEAKSA